MALSAASADARSSISRREFLQATAAAAGVVAMTHASAEAADIQSTGCIDAHSHVWTPDVERYPLGSGFTKSQMQPTSFTPAELLAQARPCGVARVVLIQMSYYRFDNRYMLDAIRDAPDTFSGVAVVDHHAAGMRDMMRELKQQGVRGFRIHPENEPAKPWLADDAMAAFWRHGADENLAVCALINPEALAPLDQMCERFPQTPVVIDHFARIGVDGTIRESDVDALCRLARHQRTYVKVSAFYALGKKQAPYLDLAPMIRRLVEAYGANRLMWATDCPYQVQAGHTYRDSIELVRDKLDFLTADDRAWMLRKTAERVFFN
ncbi:MAG: amidohydrolase family protein [Pirellulales bacterium]